jgi:hypothetical protein
MSVSAPTSLAGRKESAMSRGHASLPFIAAVIGALLVMAPVTSFANFEPPSGEVLRQDFGRADLLAAQWQPITGVWSATGGTYNSATTASSSLSTIFAYPNPAGGADLPAIPFDRYRLHARMRNPGTGASSLVGVVYQYQNAANYYEAVFSPAGTASLRRVTNGVTAAVASAPYAGGAQGIWFDVEVLWNDGRTTVRVNGIAVLNSIAQPEYTTAAVGLITHNTPAQFDNVSITIGVQPFREDFNDGAAQGFTPGIGQWNVAAGTYNSATVQQTSITFTEYPQIGRAPTVVYTLRARMLNPYGASGNLLGIVFNFKDLGDHLEYSEVVFSPTGLAKVNVVSGATIQTVATAPYKGLRNTWFDVEFVMHFEGAPNNLDVLVDGQTVFQNVSANPATRPEGRVGLITHWAPGKFDDVWFDYGVMRDATENFNLGLALDWFAHSSAWNTNAGTLDDTSAGADDVVTSPWRRATDFRYRARVLNPYGASGNRVGLVYNYQGTDDLGTGDRYEVVFAPTGEAYLDKVIQSVRYRVATGAHNAGRGVWFDVELIRSGINTTVNVNGATIFDNVPQAHLPEGHLGVVTHWTPGRFDDLSVNELR